MDLSHTIPYWKMTNRESDSGDRSLAAKLDRLFRTMTKPGGGEWSYEEVAARIRAQTDSSISAPYLWQLRMGRRDNPTLKHLQALAAFFGVPASYFTDDQETVKRIDAQLRLLAAMRDARIDSIATRAFEGQLNEQGLNALSGLLDNLLAMQRSSSGKRGRSDSERRQPASE